jgi:RNA polymerase sigma-70 factor (ECF subfamily)
MSDLAALRRRTFALAYRMTGSVADAEDVVQEAFLRRERALADGVELESEEAWLTTVATRIALDHLRSARVRREQYPGPWLPEPVVADERLETAELADTLSLAFLVLLETLTPVERAVLLLHDVFDHDFSEVAAIVGRSDEACRQAAVRARRRVAERRPRFEVSRAERDELAARFFAALSEHDERTVAELLAPDVVFYGDGGGKTVAVPEPVHGPERVGKMLLSFVRQGEELDLVAERRNVNGQPGIVGRTEDGRVVSVMALDIADGRVQAVRSIVNPDKLRHLGETADLAELRRRRRG